MQNSQAEIARMLDVVAPFCDEAALAAEIARRITFIQTTLRDSALKTLVLGISGGVDSSVAGRLAQLAVEGLRAQSGDQDYRFIALRLPYQNQHDEADAQLALAFIAADQEHTINIAAGVQGVCQELGPLEALSPAQNDMVRANIKARMRMLAQYAMANATGGLVIGTDHAAEAVMGFFTKFGDGACDLAPLSGLVKGQVRAMARYLGASQMLTNKTPTADLEELAPGKPDELSFGISYADIDAFLHCQPVSAAVFACITQAYQRSMHKRQMPQTP